MAQTEPEEAISSLSLLLLSLSSFFIIHSKVGTFTAYLIKYVLTVPAILTMHQYLIIDFKITARQPSIGNGLPGYWAVYFFDNQDP